MAHIRSHSLTVWMHKPGSINCVCNFLRFSWNILFKILDNHMYAKRSNDLIYTISYMLYFFYFFYKYTHAYTHNINPDSSTLDNFFCTKKFIYTICKCINLSENDTLISEWDPMALGFLHFPSSFQLQATEGANQKADSLNPQQPLTILPLNTPGRSKRTVINVW